MKKYGLAMLLVLAGCNSHDLEERWRPLEQLVERPRLPFLSDDALTTTGPHVWVRDLDDYLKKCPPGSISFEAAMRHEQAHSIRQGGMPGRLAWEQNYLTDAGFMWREEQIGWWFEIRYQVEHGHVVHINNLAGSLATNYRTAGGDGMTTREEATAWIREVVAGRWYPPAEVINTIRQAHAGQ